MKLNAESVERPSSIPSSSAANSLTTGHPMPPRGMPVSQNEHPSASAPVSVCSAAHSMTPTNRPTSAASAAAFRSTTAAVAGEGVRVLDMV